MERGQQDSTITTQFTNSREATKTYAVITMNERRLYICQGTVPKTAVFRLEFGGSFTIFNTFPPPEGIKPNADGEFGYASLYSNEIYGVGDVPLPPVSDTPGGASDYHPHDFDNVPVPPCPLPKGIASDGRPVGSGPIRADYTTAPQNTTR